MTHLLSEFWFEKTMAYVLKYSKAAGTPNLPYWFIFMSLFFSCVKVNLHLPEPVIAVYQLLIRDGQAGI